MHKSDEIINFKWNSFRFCFYGYLVRALPLALQYYLV